MAKIKFSSSLKKSARSESLAVDVGSWWDLWWLRITIGLQVALGGLELDFTINLMNHYTMLALLSSIILAG